MKSHLHPVCGAALLFLLTASVLFPQPGPFDGKNFQGRIAWSADGNHNDEDDWAASPVALAIFGAFGVTEQVVHFDYNSILNNNNPEWEKIHRESVLGAVERFGYDPSLKPSPTPRRMIRCTLSSPARWK